MSTYWEVDDNILPKVLQKYDRTVASLAQDIDTLRNWMKSQPHLPEILDDKRLQNFLILNKCSVERAKSRIDMYYTLRSKIPEIFENMKPENVIQKTDVVYYLNLPKLTKEMYRVFFGKVRDKINFNETLQPYDFGKRVFIIEEIRLKEDVMYGDIIILDFEGVSLSFVKRITPTSILHMFRCYEKIYSIPLKAILKAVMKPKLFERIYVSQDTKALMDNFPKEIIPKDYGGEEKSMEELNEMLKSKFKEYKNRFDVLDELKVDESLRPEPLKNDEALGFHGNFKKLDVD